MNLRDLLGFLIALLLTEALELCLVWFISRSAAFVKYMFFVNLFTNPIANLVNRVTSLFAEGNVKIVCVVIIEVFVVLGETALIRYYRRSKKEGLEPLPTFRCFIYSLGINAFSFGMGILLAGISAKM